MGKVSKPKSYYVTWVLLLIGHLVRAAELAYGWFQQQHERKLPLQYLQVNQIAVSRILNGIVALILNDGDLGQMYGYSVQALITLNILSLRSC